MCGILQVISRSLPVDRDRFERALGLMKHRGPDATGIRMHEVSLSDGNGTAHIASGHQRLSILDIDDRSNQPFFRGELSLIYNGEIYNFRELRDSVSHGLGFETSGDTEVLFRGLTAEGLDFLKRANGMWAFTFVDGCKRRILVSRDRYGKKPLFYFKDDSQVIFSSTIRAINAYLGVRTVLRDAPVDNYLVHGMTFPCAGENTHVEGIKQLAAGSHMEFDLETWSGVTREYFDVRELGRDGAPDGSELPDLVADAVKARLVSDRKVGLLLSGGIDSTLVLSAIHSLGCLENVHCFIGETGRSDDAEFAKRCIAKLGAEATVVNLGYGSETLARVLKMCRHQEKPFPLLGSAMGMAEMYERIAEHDVRVVLDGTGGDEIFGGYWGRYLPSAVLEAYGKGDWEWLRSMWREAPQARKVIWGMARSAMRRRIGFGGRKQNFSRAANALGLPGMKIAALDPLTEDFPGYIETVCRDISPGGRLGEWIWHNDRNAMMSGIENRSPILDFRLTRFVHTGYRAKFRGAFNKYELRKVFDALSPLPTQWRRQKQGFRWDGKAFVRANRDGILDRIGGSDYLASRFSVKDYVSRARSDDSIATDNLTSRLLCVAALGSELGFD